MKKKNIIIIVLILISILSITGGIIYNFIDKNNSKDSQKKTYKYTIEDAIMESEYYRTEDRKVDVVEKKDGYHIILYNKETNDLLNEFVMDKETGIISEIPTATIIMKS